MLSPGRQCQNCVESQHTQLVVEHCWGREATPHLASHTQSRISRLLGFSSQGLCLFGQRVPKVIPLILALKVLPLHLETCASHSYKRGRSSVAPAPHKPSSSGPNIWLCLMKSQIIHDSHSAFLVKATSHSCLYFIRGFGHLSPLPPKPCLEGTFQYGILRSSAAYLQAHFFSPSVLFPGMKEADGTLEGGRITKGTQGYVISSQNKLISV